MWSNLMKPTNNQYDKLDAIFGTHMDEVLSSKEEKLPVVVEEPLVPQIISTGDDIEDDYLVARKKLNDLIGTSQQALEGMLNVALASDSPRAYEVVGQLIKTTGDAAKDLLDLQSKKKRLREEEPKKQNIDTQNNIIFSGSTSDLLKALKAEKAKVIDHE
jgi:hypothetical protein